MKKYFLNSLFILLSFTAVFAQPNNRKEEKRDRVESLRIAYISEKLELTPEEAQRFWPLYNQFREQQKAIHKDLKQTKTTEDMTPAEADAQMTANLERDEKMFAARKEFQKKLRGVIPTEKIIRLQNIEQDFKSELKERIKERQKRKENIRRN